MCIRDSFVFPTEVTADPDGKTLWVADYGRRNRIMEFRRDGTFIREWGPDIFTTADLDRPMAVVLAPDGATMFVADAGNSRVNVYDRAGNQVRTFGTPGIGAGQMKYPLDLALAPDGTLYVVEYGNSRLSRYTMQGEYLGSWGRAGFRQGEFYTPWGCAVGPDGTLVIADTNNQRLQLLANPAPHFKPVAAKP